MLRRHKAACSSDQRVIRAGLARYTPIHHQHFAEVAEHHVLRLEIAVDDAVGMSEGDRFADAQENAQQLGRRSLQFIETPPAHELHGVPEAPIRQQPDVVQRHDPGMFEPGDGPGLGAHPLDGILGSQLAGQHLDGNAAVQLDVLRFIDDAHPAASELVLDAVARSAEIWELGDGPEMSDCVVGEPGHTSTPRSDRTSARYSLSEAVASRNTSRTIARKRRRIAARPLVTLVSLSPKRSPVWR